MCATRYWTVVYSIRVDVFIKLNIFKRKFGFNEYFFLDWTRIFFVAPLPLEADVALFYVCIHSEEFLCVSLVFI